MEDTGKISVSQLFLLLFLSRAFSLVAYSPSFQGGGEKITLITTLLSGGLQALLLVTGVSLCRRRAGNSPLIVPAGGPYRALGGLYWLFAMAVCVYTAVNFISFVTAAVYDYRYGGLVAVTLAAAGALAASQGLEGLARGAGILTVLLGLGCAVIALGLWRQYDWQNFTFRLLSPGDTLRGVWQGFARNGELFALLLLLPCLRGRPKAVSCAVWTAGLALASAAVQMMTMLTLGAYGGRKAFPVFTAVTSAGFRAFQRLDSVFLVIWVVLGLVKLAVFLSLASGLSAGLFFRPRNTKWIWGNAAVVLAASLALWRGPEGWMEGFHTAVSTGAVTLPGVLLLPLWGKLMDGGRAKE